MRYCGVVVLLMLATFSVKAQITKIFCLPAGSSWNVYQPEAAASKAFSLPRFEDLPLVYNEDDWKSYTAPLGFNTTGLQTDLKQTMPGVEDRKAIYLYTNKFSTQHYPSDIDSLVLRVRYNDGFVVYLNGVEVARKNLPAFPTPLTNTTEATAAHADTEYELINISLYKSVLINGNQGLESENQIAVEVHQAAGEGKDMAFDLEAYYTRSTSAVPIPLVVRKPYLQMAGPTTMTVRWRTNIPTATELSYGTSQIMPDLNYTDPTETTDHVAILTGLSPHTTYYYSLVGVQAYVNDVIGQHFKTAPLEGADVPVRIWAIGDFGVGIPPQTTTFASYLAKAASRPADIWMWAGDNAYQSGTDQQYQDYVFTIYDPIFRNHVLYPTTGNHDMESCDPNKELGPYFDIFSLPRNGENGGVPSGTEAYNSSNYGPIHIVNLESSKTDVSPNGAMANWLRRDLAVNKQKWTIVQFHHPLYSGGGHLSDDAGKSQQLRENFLPILEAGGVDLIITGHSHDFERTFLINEHYGLSNTFVESQHLIQGGDGKISGDGAYLKPKESPYSRKGMVHAMVGNSGLTDVGGQLEELPAVFYGTTNPGSAIIDISGDTLTFRHLDGISQQYSDEFSIVKSLSAVPCDIPITLPAQLTICPGEALTLDPGPGYLQYNWSNGTKNQALTVVQPGTYTLTAHRSATCFKTFTTTVLSKLNTGFTVSKEVAMINEPIYFADTTSNILSTTWNFGDGTTSELPNLLHSYSQPGSYVVTLQNANAECTNTATRQLTIADPSGIEKTKGGDLRILAYPNPTNGILNVELEALGLIENLDISLSNSTGTIIYTKHIDKLEGSFSTKIDLNGSADGAYFLTVAYPGGKFSKKVILH